MKSFTNYLSRWLIIVSLILSLALTISAQTKRLLGVQDHTSIARVGSTNGEGIGVSFINPYTNVRDTYFAGVFNGTLNSTPTKFYCIDINTHLARNEDYWDEGSTPKEITYILNNYFPFNTSNYTGKLSDINKEAAAIQFAIWHFSDGVDVNSINGNDAVKNRANAIIADALAKAGLNEYLETILIIPPSQSFVEGTVAYFDVYTSNLNGTPASNIQVQLTTTLGTLSTNTVTTDAVGHAGPISITYTGLGTATISARANVTIPQGTKYVYKADANARQKLVLATPSFDTKEVQATVTWYKKPGPNDCDLKGYTTFTQGGWGSPSNSAPGKIRDMYFSTVFPSGLVIGSTYKLTLTSATAVKNFLPQGGTAGAFSQNYTDATATSAGVLAGQLVALKLNVSFDAAEKLGTNTTNLGDLTLASGPFVGITVNAFLAMAEQAIGGGSLNGHTFSEFNDAATAINENFDNGTVDKGFLVCMKIECQNIIGSYVYRDKNANGIKDSGEQGIAGVVVELLQGTTVLATATTDINGQYSFQNILNGTYIVRLAASNFASGGVFYSSLAVKWYTKNSTSVNTTLNCNDNLSINFGYYKTCVSITKTSNKQSYNNGETIIYSFTVENCGDIQLHGGIDVFDAMLNPAGNHLIKHIDVLDPGQSTTFTYSYLTTANDCGQITNTVRAEGHPVDGSPSVVDQSSWTVTVICQEKADVKVEKLVDNPNPKCDDNVTFTIKASNLGPNSASGVQVTDLLPTGLDYISSTASQGTYNSNTGIWNVGTLASGAFATLTIKVKVNCESLNDSAFDLGTAKDYNLFVIEDANQPSSDTQGKVAVGRDASFANYSIGDQLPSNSGDVLIVGRDLTYTSGAVYNGNVVYGHSTNLPIPGVSITGGTLRKDSPIDFAAAKAYLENLSTTLSAYTVNGTTTAQWGGLTLTGADPFLNVFIVSGSSMSSANNISINVPNGSVVLINISGTNVSWSGGLTVNGTAINNVLYNFYEATTLSISGIDIKGSVLAPFAALNFVSGVINGQMICKSLTGMGQFNHSPFNGHIPKDRKITNVATITSAILDPNPNNNSSSVTISISGNTSGNGGNNGNGGSTTQLCTFGQGEIVYSLAYSENAIYAGTWGGKIYKSTDGGKTWTVINPGMNVSFIWSLNITGGVIFAATEQGVFKYNGTTWTLTGLSGKDVHALTSFNGTLYAGTWGYGVFKSTNLGSTWTEINNGLGAYLTIQALTIRSSSGSGHVYAGTVGGGLFKCTDGINWTKLNFNYNAVWSLASTSTAIFVGTYGDGLYKSTNSGYSFTKVTSLSVSFVYSMAVDLSGKIYVSSLTNGVFVSSDNGTTWTSLGMGGYGVSAMIVNPTSDDVYVGTKTGELYKISASNSVTDVDNKDSVPTEFKLQQNYPNPFNPTTSIEFAIPAAGKYSLKVYNILGQEVANLVNNELAAGVHKVTFDASRFASGMYIYNLSGNNVNLTKKMLLMK